VGSARLQVTSYGADLMRRILPKITQSDQRNMGVNLEKQVYDIEAQVEDNHWWFTGRRQLFAYEMARANIRQSSFVLDVGVGGGSNLRMLAEMQFQHVIGLDPSPDVVQICQNKGFASVQQGGICNMPFSSESFDFVLATDVIEHVGDDVAALQEICRVLRSGGYALITVPAFPSLWGLQDKVALHYRRYHLRTLLERVAGAQLAIVRAYYFNYLLFAPIWTARQIIRFGRIRLQSENEVNSRLINRVLTTIFRLDVATAPILHPPFGVSALVFAQKSKA
jgi:SAM-dependent methyltransferase